MADNPAAAERTEEVAGASRDLLPVPTASTSRNTSRVDHDSFDISSVTSVPPSTPGLGTKSVTKKTADKPRAKQTARLSFLSAAEIQVFTNFVKNFKATGELRREDAVALDFMFGHTIQQVFELVEEDHVSIRKSPQSRKVLIEVGGKSGNTYWIPPGHSLCQCLAFLHMKKDYCKHVLAAHLALAIIPKEEYKPMSDEELTKIYKEFIEDALK